MNEPDDKLAAALDQEFKKLPDLRAPQALAGSVMELVKKYESRPWWQRSWFEWPAGLRWVSAIAMLVTLAGMGFADVVGLQPALARGTAAVNEALAAVGSLVTPLLEIAGSILANVPMYLWCLIAVGVALSWVASLGLGVVCYQLIRTRKHKHS